MSFSSLGLSTELLRAVEAQGYSTPTPIQQQAIPLVLSGRDLLAGAQTGTGKTAGFTLPLLQRLSADPAAQARGTRRVRALILTPTRELAAQVAESVQTYGQHLPLRSAVIFGGVNINPQITALRRGVDIVIATPGRLLDHAQSRTIDLSHVETLVLDEADRMLDMGFIRDIRRVLALLPARRQNLLFSATFSDEIRALARDLLNDPAEVQVAPRNAAADQVSQIVHPVDAARKREMLAHMIGANDWRQVLVFTRTKHGANRLSEQLVRSGLSAAAIHGNKSQGARTRALAGFKAGEVRVLVATDIAARGLDIEQLPHVVNFELPAVPEDYVHRIGRTGRAGAAGHAVSLVSPDESSLLSAIERLLGRRIEQRVLDGYAPGRPLSTGEPGRGAGARAAASASRPAQAGARQERGRPVAGGRDKPGAGAERGKSFGGERGKPFNADRVKPSAPERHPPGVRAEAPARPAKNAAPARPALTQSPVAGPVRRAEEEGAGPRRRSRRSRGGRGGRPGAPAGAG